MARGRVVRSAINAALDNVKAGQKAAKEVIEGSTKSANKNATMIKNCINNVQSNLGSGQAKAIAEMGEDSGRALREGINNAVNQTKAKTAQKALDNHTYQGNSAVQKSREIIDRKTTNKVIDGHNAKQRDVEMQTIVNNVKDRNINRVPQGHETARNAVDNANQTVRKNLETQRNAANQFDPYNTSRGRRIGNRDNIRNAGDYEPARLIDDDNATVQNSPWSNNQQEPKQNFKEVNRPPDPPPEAKPNPFDHEAIEPEFDTSNGSGGDRQNSRTRERMNREFNDRMSDLGGKAKDTFLGGILDSYDNIRYGEQGLFEGIKNAHINDDGSMNWRRAAGTFMTTSAAARVASGGGLYKDRYGNPNLIGVPFI